MDKSEVNEISFAVHALGDPWKNLKQLTYDHAGTINN